MEKNNYTKKEVLQLMYQAFESGFKKYEVVDAGLESIETKEECGWILRSYDSDLEKEIQKETQKETQKQLITEIMNEDAKDGLYKKQTAVEWFIEQIKEYDFTPPSNNEEYVIVMPKWIFDAKRDEAKEMHKEEIIHSYRCGAAEVGMIAVNKPKQYYNETFKSK